MVTLMEATKEQIIEFLEGITDPEIPVVNIVELGIVRDVHYESDSLQVDITPTYSGCPAMKVIEDSIYATLQEKGFENISVKTVFSPPWTTDWLTDQAKQKLKDYGIAPPEKSGNPTWMPFSNANKKVPCPFCCTGSPGGAGRSSLLPGEIRAGGQAVAGRRSHAAPSPHVVARSVARSCPSCGGSNEAISLTGTPRPGPRIRLPPQGTLSIFVENGEGWG